MQILVKPTKCLSDTVRCNVSLLLQAAVWSLFRGHQLELAFCVGSVLGVDRPTRLAARLLARRCERLQRRCL